MQASLLGVEDIGKNKAQEPLFALVDAIERLSSARSLDEIVEIVRVSARRIAEADGVTFVLRDGDLCHYVAENAISPLWAGQRFPLQACISGWCMLNGRAAVIPDIYADPRIPHGAYRPTFVSSLIMVPVGADKPLAAIGAYWAKQCQPPVKTVSLIETLARSTAVALANVQLYSSLTASERQARERLAELEALYRAAPVALAMIGADGHCVRVNDAMAAIGGAPVEAYAGRPIREMLPGLSGAAQSAFQAALDTGNAAGPFEFTREMRTWLQSSAPVKNASGDVQGAVISALEITGQKKAEETQRLLIAELNHRVKNTLAAVQSLARQTHKSAKEPADFIARFDGRLQSLSKAHELLTETHWAGAGLEDLVREQLAIGGEPADGQLDASGPAVSLDPDTAQQLGLILHELAANARNYGALSVPDGRVQVRWTVVGDAGAYDLTLRWTESGGPAVTPPEKRGFGSILIEKSLHPIGGYASLAFLAGGVIAEIRIPIEVRNFAKAPASPHLPA